MKPDILFLPGKLGGWELEFDDVEQAPDGSWDVGLVAYKTVRNGKHLRAGVSEDVDGYEAGVAIAHSEHLESESNIDDLGDAFLAMVDLMYAYSHDDELGELVRVQGSSPVMAR